MSSSHCIPARPKIFLEPGDAIRRTAGQGLWGQQYREANVKAGVLRWTLPLAVFLGVALCGVGVARAETNNCGEPPEPSHYLAQSGDTEDAQHLTVERTFAGQGRLEFNMCSGELHIERGH